MTACVRPYRPAPVTPDPQSDPRLRVELLRPDGLAIGCVTLVTDTVTITGAMKYRRGTLLGKVTSSGSYRLAVGTAEDGSQTPIAVLAVPVDATDADVQAGIYLQGEFNANAITIDPSLTLEAAQIALRPLSIYLRDVPATSS
jgi:hypothetical protein